MSTPPALFDRDLHFKRLARAARGFDSAAFLKARAAEDIVERIDVAQREFPTALELTARTGVLARALNASPAAAKVHRLIQSDPCPAMIRQASGERVASDAYRSPFADSAFDLVVSALGLHWVDDLVGVMVQARRALRPDGLFIATLPAVGTLKELRACLLEAESEMRGGAGPRIAPFVDPIDGASLLQRAGFALPVVDTDRVVVRYRDPLRLLTDLRAMGETVALAHPSDRPLTREILARALALYSRNHADPDGKVRATFEFVTLTGWAPSADQPKPARRGSAQASLAEALEVIRRSRDADPG